MATSSSDCSARVYDVRADFKELAVMKGHREEVSKVPFKRLQSIFIFTLYLCYVTPYLYQLITNFDNYFASV